MENDFERALADFLEERLGKALFTLHKKNEEYRNLSDEYETLLKIHSDNIEEYRQAITKISEIGKKLSDCEKHYLFLVGIHECIRLEDVLLSEAFERLFLGIE